MSGTANEVMEELKEIIEKHGSGINCAGYTCVGQNKTCPLILNTNYSNCAYHVIEKLVLEFPLEEKKYEGIIEHNGISYGVLRWYDLPKTDEWYIYKNGDVVQALTDHVCDYGIIVEELE